MNESSQTVLIYERLKQGILSLDLVPGERLTERGLEATLSASRTPVRAALTRLESEGLVQREGRGWMVAPLDLDEIRHLLEYREVIEGAGARLATDRASDEGIARLDGLLAEFERGEGEPAFSGAEGGGRLMGGDFHLELVRLAGNPLLVLATENALTRLARTRWLEVRTAESRRLALAEHRAIVEAVQRRDADAAEAAAVAHIRKTGERLAASLDADHRKLRARGFSFA